MRRSGILKVMPTCTNRVSCSVLSLRSGNQIRTMGVFECSASLQGQLYCLKCNLVASDALNVQVIIGKDFLAAADVHMSADGVRVFKREGVGNSVELEPVGDREQEQLVSEYSQKKNVVMPIETKIILKDEVPIYEQARRLAPLEWNVRSKQVAD